MTTLARRVERYLSGLTIRQGALAGQRMEVLPWQRRYLRGALRPGVYESALTMARGGGKSTFTAGLACAALTPGGPLVQRDSEVVVVAATLGQAQVIFRHVRRFIGPDVGKRKLYRSWDSVSRAAIMCRETGVLLELKASNPQGLHGLAPSLIIGDELAQWPPNRIDALLSALDTSLGKIPGGRFWKIGTRAATSGHPFELALKTADYAQVHAARPDDPPFHKRTWIRACPSVAHFPHLEAKIRAEAKKARVSDTALATFRALRLNLGTPDTLAEVLVDPDDWERAEGDVGARGACVWGCDLGTTAASSAVAAFWPETGRLDCLAAFPAVPTLAERGLRDGVGRLYEDQHARRELIVTDGHATSVPALMREALERFGRPAAVAADRWRDGELRDGLHDAGVPLAKLVLRGQGYKDGGADVRSFRRGIAEGRVTPVVSLVLRSAMAEARTVTDAAGNSKLAKNVEGGRRKRARDDAAAAAILAVAEGLRRAARRPRRRGIRYAVVR